VDSIQVHTNLEQLLLVVTRDFGFLETVRRLGKELSATVRTGVASILRSVDPVLEALLAVSVLARNSSHTRWCKPISTDDALHAFWVLDRRRYVVDGDDLTDLLQLRSLRKSTLDFLPAL
jgi:hypothetical protein